MLVLRLGLALACFAAATTAVAQGPNPRSIVEVRGTVRPAPDNFASYRDRTSGAFRDWKHDQDKRLTSYNYRTVLRFAECVARFDRTAASRVLHSAVQSVKSSNELTRMAETKRACVVEHSKVHPLLLRVALAETRLKHDETGAPARGQSAVGVPAVVDGYRLGQIAHCQVRSEPQSVHHLLVTEPGSAAERLAAEALFERARECGTASLGRLTPTAARLAVVDAEYARRFAPGRSR